MTNSDNTKKNQRGFQSELLIDAATQLPLVTAFAPRTESEVEARQRLALEWRRRQWESNRRRYRFEGCDEESRDV